MAGWRDALNGQLQVSRLMQPIPPPQLPVFILVRDRLKFTQDLCDWILQTPNGVPVLVDNCSTWPPLLEWLDRTDMMTIRLQKNMAGGFLALIPDLMWRMFPSCRFYAVTDHDLLPIADCPRNALEFLCTGLFLHPEVRCAGFGLDLLEIPKKYPHRAHAIEEEGAHWQKSTDRGPWFFAPIDTTFAVYDVLRLSASVPYYTSGVAIRSSYPYVVHHRPWHLAPTEYDEEEQWYRQHTQGGAYVRSAGDAMPAGDEVKARKILAALRRHKKEREG